MRRLEKHCRVSAKCYPTKVPALYTMAKENISSFFRILARATLDQEAGKACILRRMIRMILLMPVAAIFHTDEYIGPTDFADATSSFTSRLRTQMNNKLLVMNNNE